MQLNNLKKRYMIKMLKENINLTINKLKSNNKKKNQMVLNKYFLILKNILYQKKIKILRWILFHKIKYFP